MSIKPTTPVYKKFNKVMAVDENKSELFKLVATEVTSLAKDIDTTVVVTHKESVVSNKEIDKEYLEPCVKEEADARMFLHTIDLVRKG